MNPRTCIALVLVGALLGMAVAAGAAVVDSGKQGGENVVFHKAGGPNVTMGAERNFTNENPWADSGQITLEPWGNFTSQGDTELRVDRFNGTWTNTSQLDVSNSELVVDINDKQDVGIEGPFSDFAYRDMALDDGTVDFSYSAGSDGGAVTVHSLPANTYIGALSASGTLLAANKTTAGGTLTLTKLSGGSQDVELFSSAGGPIVDNASASPDGAIDSDEQTLSVNVSDPDLPNDEITVEFFVDGESAGTDTLAANGTAETNVTVTTGGTHEWNVTAVDEFGQVTTSDRFTMKSPDELEIREETGSQALIDNATTEVEFYFRNDGEPDLVVERNTTTGKLNMTGLPANKPFVVVASSEGYFNRRIFVSSLYDRQVVYLLNDTADAVQPTFTLTDFTGDYPTESTVLKIQRYINGEWRTVEGDYFGAANQMTAQVVFNERYRLIITDVVSGRSRSLGSYTPTATSTIELEVHEDQTIIADDVLPSMTVSPSIDAITASADTSFTVDVDAGSANLGNYTVEAVLSNGTTLFQRSGDSASGETMETTLDLVNATGQDLAFWVNWTTADGTSGSTRAATYIVRESGQNSYSLLGVLTGASLGGESPNTLTILITLVFATLGTGYAATRMSSGAAGLAGLAVVIAGAVLTFVPWNWVVAGAVTWVVLVGIQNRF